MSAAAIDLVIDLTLPLAPFELRVEVALGEAAAVLGPSGAGKTSLLESLAGLRPAARGTVRVGDAVLQDSSRGVFVPPERRRLGWVPQDGALFPHLTVRDNLLFGAGQREAGEERSDQRSTDRFDDLVAALELAPLLERRPRHLSGGERRRVALGRALLARPRLLLLDEPTAGLDRRSARRALGRIRALRRELGVPLLLVTHRWEEAAALADQVVVLERGRVRDQGPTREVLARLGSGPGTDLETFLEARVVAQAPEDGVTRVVLEEGTPLGIPHRGDLSLGEPVVLAVGAGDILVSTREPRDLSARNAVAVTLDGLVAVESASTEAGPSKATLLRAGPWWVRVTPEAVRELDLAPGRRVWLVVKTHALRVVAGGGSSAVPGASPPAPDPTGPRPPGS